MKTARNLRTMKPKSEILVPFAVALLFIFNSVLSFAQSAPEKVEVDINADGGSVWYGQPWVWAVGIAVFIVLIVAITRSNSKNA
ncbi:hypothetical protein GZH53_03380 [Flavihumibacter sp. R14]|nr:hypothetical protein [Flavihumibacter soli]